MKVVGVWSDSLGWTGSKTRHDLDDVDSISIRKPEVSQLK